MAESNFAFQRRMAEIHPRGLRDEKQPVLSDETVIDDSWEIVYPLGASRVLSYAARDFEDFLAESMRVFARVRYAEDINAEIASPMGKIVLTTAALSPEYAPASGEPMAYRLSVAGGAIVCGREDRGTAQGLYAIERGMGVRRAPVLKHGETEREPLFSPRMVHSGYALDEFPDSFLKAAAHCGMDAILVYVSGVNRTTHGYIDFNDLVYRAAGFGLDVYAYSQLPSGKHPDDPDAKALYESTYGQLFKHCPGFKGVVFVGESIEFPSHDKHVVPYTWRTVNAQNNPNKLPTPGWYPCEDYPEWVNMVKGVIRAQSPDADIVFWTYNWGYVEREARLRLIRALPTDITLLVTFEMFEKFDLPGDVHERCTDYTLFFEGPGEYFASEAEEAKKRGLRLYAMSNTGGLTWDVGDVPYLPCPRQWNRRVDALVAAREKWGLCGLMESHHYGFYPSFVSEIVNRRFGSDAPSFEDAQRDAAARDFGEANAQEAIQAWDCYSEGIRHCVSTNPDQYGAFRVGPSYPLLYKEPATFPSEARYMHGGNAICDPMYKYDVENDLPSYLHQIAEFERMAALFQEGNAHLERAMVGLDERQSDNAARLRALGEFIMRAAMTAVHVKKWYLLKRKLLAGADSPAEIKAEMRKIADAEIENARLTMPAVELDSRLGFEPSMGYMADRAHLEWKIETTRHAVEQLMADGNPTE